MQKSSPPTSVDIGCRRRRSRLPAPAGTCGDAPAGRAPGRARALRRRASENRSCTGSFSDLLREVGLRRRERAVEVGDGFSLPAVEIALDLVDQDARLQPCWMAARAYQSRSSRSLTLSSRTQLWNHGNCAATCCTNSCLGPDFGEPAHVFEVAGREAFHVGKRVL